MLCHTYPAVGSYMMKRSLQAEFTNGAVTSKFQSEVIITY